MAEWEDEALAIRCRRFGEHDAIIDVFGRSTGMGRGLVRGGAGRRRRGILQPGNTLSLRWRGRLEEQLGYFSPVEAVRERAVSYYTNPLALSGMTASLALLAEALPAKQVKPGLYDSVHVLFDHLHDDHIWPRLFILWEVEVLGSLGYGLDLRRCALTGVTDGLCYVSPRSGRAVCKDAATPWRERLLPLPAFLLDSDAASGPSEIGAGLVLTGHFLQRHVFGALNRALPPARAHMIARLEKAGIATEHRHDV